MSKNIHRPESDIWAMFTEKAIERQKKNFWKYK